MGGTFEIDKRDIVRISTVKGEGSDDNGAVTPETGSAEGGTAETGNAEKTSQDGSGSRRKAAAKRLEEIRQRKSELKNEREKLSREREQLQSDIKNAPDWMPVKQYDEINRKNSDIERRIKSFNEEVRGLDAEEKGIQEELKAGRTGARAAPSVPGSAATPEPAGVPATE
jgi:chromosome segregation ATPase